MSEKKNNNIENVNETNIVPQNGQTNKGRSSIKSEVSKQMKRLRKEEEIRAEIQQQIKKEQKKEEEIEAEKEKERKKREKRYKFWKRFLELTALILFLLLFANRCSLPMIVDKPDVAPIKDANSINHEDVQFQIPDDYDAESNQIVCMNLTPVFPNGKAEGLLYIDNDAMNVYDQNVKIYLVKNGIADETQCIYESGRIEPGQTVQYAPLDVDLPAGKYDCVAAFYALQRVEDQETGAMGAIVVGRTDLIVTVTVQQ